MKFRSYLQEMNTKVLSEALKKFKSPLDLGCEKGEGCYFLHSVGLDTNGNWSYMVSKGSNKPKKIQHQGDWSEKITASSTESDLKSIKTSKEIIAYYIEFVK